jgi:pimeloyl-ACP methyl ester carboxylesterase
MPIAYALAADHRNRVERLVVSEAPLPGISPSPPLFLPPLLNARLWHLMFNQLPAEVNEALVRGREAVFFGAEFDASAGTNKLPADAVSYYIERLASDPDALRGSFGFYRAIPTTTAQNQQRKEQRLTLPVLAIGGAESSGDMVGAHDAARRRQCADHGSRRRWPLGCRAGARGAPGGPDHVPGPLPRRADRLDLHFIHMRSPLPAAFPTVG